MTTITVQLDDELHARVRELATARKTTVPQMLERYLRVLAQPPVRPDEMSPALRAIYGMAPPMSDDEVERTLDDELTRKHG